MKWKWKGFVHPKMKWNENVTQRYIVVRVLLFSHGCMGGLASTITSHWKKTHNIKVSEQWHAFDFWVNCLLNKMRAQNALLSWEAESSTEFQSGSQSNPETRVERMGKSALLSMQQKHGIICQRNAIKRKSSSAAIEIHADSVWCRSVYFYTKLTVPEQTKRIREI